MPKTVLLVDDDALFRRMIGDGLRAAGYQVAEAADGLEALEQVRRSRPDFILLDLIMPKLDGFRVCKMLKGHPEHQTIPVIVMTGLGNEALKNLPELGAEAAVPKRGGEATLAELQKTLQLLGAARLKPAPVLDSAQDLAEWRIVNELLAERQHTQSVLANLGEGVAELDDRGRVVYINRMGLTKLGLAEDTLLGSLGAALLGEAAVPALGEAIRMIQAGGDPVRLELPYRQKTLGVTLTSLPRADGPPGALLVLRDLTDLARRVRNLAAVTAVARQILAHRDPAIVLREIVTRTADLLETDRCGLFRAEGVGADLQFRCAQAVGLSADYVAALHLAPGEAVVGRAVAERRPVATPDISRDRTFRLPVDLRPQLAREGIGAILAAPLVTGEAALGALVVYRPAGYHFTPEEVELVTCLAEAAAIALENARLHEEMQRYAR